MPRGPGSRSWVVPGTGGPASPASTTVMFMEPWSANRVPSAAPAAAASTTSRVTSDR